MATISSLGVGSGLDLNGLLTKLMSVEQQPLIQLAQREATASAKISALGSLSGSISSLLGSISPLIPATGKTAAEHFTTYKTAVADTAIASASASTGAVAGTYSLEVSSLAVSQRLVSGAGFFAASTSPALDSGTTGRLKIEIGKLVGGTFTQKAGTTAATITIDSSNNTLAGVRDAINAANAGVSATIVTGTGGPQLVLASKSTGLENIIKITDLDATPDTDPTPNGDNSKTGPLSRFVFDPEKPSASAGALTESAAPRLVSKAGVFAASTSPALDSPATTGQLTIEIGKVDGTFTPKAGTTAVTITIDTTNNTLAGVRDAINAAKTYISATIVTGPGGPQLVLASRSTAPENIIKVTDTGGTLSRFVFDPVNPGTSKLAKDITSGGQTAADASVQVNGIAATSSTNVFSGLIDGVTLTAAKTNVGSPTALTVTKGSSLSGALTAFVKTYNETAATLTDLGRYDSTGKNNGALLGNSTLRTVTSQLRGLVSGVQASVGTNSGFRQLGDIGISYQRDGTLKLDTAKLQAAFDKDPTAVGKLTTAFANTMKSALSDSKGLPGIVSAATEGLNRTVTDYGKTREILGRRLNEVQARYVKQFSSLDSMVAGLNKTSAYLQQQLASLPGASS